jgi:hypothetical protein
MTSKIHNCFLKFKNHGKIGKIVFLKKCLVFVIFYTQVLGSKMRPQVGGGDFKIEILCFNMQIFITFTRTIDINIYVNEESYKYHSMYIKSKSTHICPAQHHIPSLGSRCEL